MSSGGGHPLFGFSRATALSGGTGPSTTVASLLWGPAFGDPQSFIGQGEVSGEKVLDYGNKYAAQAAFDLWTVDQLYMVYSQAAVDLTEINLDYGTELQSQAALIDNALEITPNDLNPQGAVDLWSIEQTHQMGIQGGVDLVSLLLDGDLGLAVGYDSTYQYTVSSMLPQEDMYLDENQDTTNFGSVTELECRQANALGNAARNAYVAWDLTGFPNGANTPDTQEVTFIVHRDGGLINANLNFEIYYHTSKPFEEDTATWDNTEQPPGTLLQTDSFDGVGSTPESRTYTIPDSHLDTAIGNWYYFRFIGETGLGNTQNFIIRSKEHATAGDRPQLYFTQEITL